VRQGDQARQYAVTGASGAVLHGRCIERWAAGNTPSGENSDASREPGAAVQELQALCRCAAEAKGSAAVSAIFRRLGIRRLDEIKSQQKQELRTAIEALLEM
jgi:hypothetical protein